MNYCTIDKMCHADRYREQNECEFGECKIFKKEPWCAYKGVDGYCGNRNAWLDALAENEGDAA